MKKFIFFTMLTILSSNVFSQAPYITWNVTNSNTNILNCLEYATGITATNDGGFVFTGATSEGNPTNGYDQLINVKVDARGNTIWKKLFGFAYNEVARKVRATSDGGYINVGSVEAEGSGCHTRPTGSSRNYYDMWIYKSNAAGDEMWRRCYGSVDFDNGYDIRELPTGGYIAVGRSTTASGDVTSHAGGGDLFAVKISASGTLQWSKSFGTSAAEIGNAVIITSDGKCVIAGTTGTDGYAIKIDTATGNLVWQKTYAGNATDVLNGITEDATGNLIFTGTTNSTSGVVTTNAGLEDLWALKTDAAGTVIWSKTFGSTSNDRGNAIVANADGSVVINAYTAGNNGDVTVSYGGGDQWVVKLSSAGTLVWQKSMGSTGTEGGADIIKTNDGGYATVSTTNALATSFDVSCPKGYLWAAKLGGTENSIPAGAILRLKADAGVATTGSLVNTWADQSGFAYNAAAVSGLAKPQLVTNEVNGRPVIRFTGTEGLTTTLTSTFGCRNKADVFLVLKKQPSAVDQTILDTYSQNPVGSNNGIFLKSNIKTTTCNNCITDNGFAAGMQINNVQSINATYNDNTENCYKIIEGKFDGSLNGDEAQLYINNNRVSRVAALANGNSNGIFEDRPISIGFTTTSAVKSNFFSGDIAEIIIYPTILDVTSQKAVYDTLYAKYLSGNNQPFTNIVPANTPSTSFTNDGQWKHTISSANVGKAMVSVQDKCNELTALSSTVYVDANPVYTAANGETFLRRHYTIQATGALRVRLYFTQSEFNDYATSVSGVNSIYDLGVIKYNGPTEDGVYDLSDATQYASFTNADTGSLYGNKYLEFETNGFSEFWIKSKQIILPLKRLDFYAEKCNKNTCLTWKTTDEINTQKFELYKSTDGINFKLLNSVNAIGNGNNSYNIIDREMQNTVFYYRLKMIDVDGKFTFSNTIKVRFEKDKNIELFPNPSNNYFSLRGINNVKEIAVVDVTGKVIKTFLPNVSNKYDISNLPATIYFLKIKDIDGEVQINRLLKISF
jgi:hypothetical protein